MKKIGIGCLWITLMIAAVICYAANLFGVSPDISFELFGRTFTSAGWWTLPLVIPGLLGLIFGAGRGFSAAMLLLGGTALCSAQGLIPESIGAWAIIWRGMLVIAVADIIFSAVDRGKRRKMKRTAQSGGKYAAIFSSHRAGLGGEIFTGASVSAFCGSMTLDLSGSIVGTDIFIDISSAFGAVTVILPPGLAVNISSSPLLASVKKQYPAAAAAARTAYIRADAAFGKVIIR